MNNTPREVQVGDIYQTNAGKVAHVWKVSENIVYTSLGNYYKNSGIRVRSTDYEDYNNNEENLNLSKHYKLVEITDD